MSQFNIHASRTPFRMFPAYIYFPILVPVTAVALSSPSGTTITVTKNVSTQFQFTTSEERPRSTVQWYISGNSVPLGTEIITQTDNDTLASTISKMSYSFNRNLTGRQLYCTAFNTDDQTPVESNRKEITVECKYLYIQKMINTVFVDLLSMK